MPKPKLQMLLCFVKVGFETFVIFYEMCFVEIEIYFEKCSRVLWNKNKSIGNMSQLALLA